mmetsp:Transcript_27232/g.91654  ORF Transcript_27232/g.91654 Transcript_27232/m.91654 type:complete len:221 (+) Transcript_27232:251-913(+)
MKSSLAQQPASVTRSTAVPPRPPTSRRCGRCCRSARPWSSSPRWTRRASSSRHSGGSGPAAPRRCSQWAASRCSSAPRDGLSRSRLRCTSATTCSRPRRSTAPRQRLTPPRHRLGAASMLPRHCLDTVTRHCPTLSGTFSATACSRPRRGERCRAAARPSPQQLPAPRPSSRPPASRRTRGQPSPTPSAGLHRCTPPPPPPPSPRRSWSRWAGSSLASPT